MRIVLASGSPRRRELLQSLGLRFRVAPTGVSEETAGLPPHEAVVELAKRKARSAESESEPAGDRLIIAADTLVHMDGDALGKPRDREEAFRMLRRLSGREHRVLTGLALILQREGRRESTAGYEETRVRFKPLTDQEIERYVDTGEPLDKAGGYGIQGRASIFVEGIHGCYFNVVGLPLHRLYILAQRLGFDLTEGGF